jgi:hypothetical protein
VTAALIGPHNSLRGAMLRETARPPPVFFFAWAKVREGE